MSWTKRFGKLVLLLLLAELIFFFLLGTRIRKQLEGPREFLGRLESAAGSDAWPTAAVSIGRR